MYIIAQLNWYCKYLFQYTDCAYVAVNIRAVPNVVCRITLTLAAFLQYVAHTRHRPVVSVLGKLVGLT